MRRIIFFIIFGFVFGSAVFGQQPGNAPAPVEFAPLINWDDVFDGITSWFTDILKEYWVLLLSIFFVWMAVMAALSFLEGRMDRWKAEARIRESIKRQEVLEEARISRREAKAAEQRRLAAIEAEPEYRSRELAALTGGMHLTGTERFANINGDYYVRSESHDVVTYKTIEQWRQERDAVDSEPLEFDNNDYGRTYDSIVESDYRRDMFGVPLGKDEEYREYKEQVEEDGDFGLAEPYEENVGREYKSESSEGRGIGDCLKDVFSSRRNREENDYSEDDFEREYGHRRGEFRGGY